MAPRRKTADAVETTETEMVAEEGFVDLTDEELAAQIEGYADLPQSVKNELAFGRRASWETQQRIAALAALEAPAEEPASEPAA
jgi:hypothetical protein